MDFAVKQPVGLASDKNRQTLAPDLLSVLQQAVALRFFVTLLSAIIYVLLSRTGQFNPPAAYRWIVLYAVIESLVLLVIVIWPVVRHGLGRFFLPLALGWFLLAPLMQRALVVFFFERAMTGPGERVGLAGVDLEAIWLAVPVVLAAWQYGAKGWSRAMLTLVAGYVLLALLVGPNLALLGDYVLVTIGRLGMVGLLGYIVMRLVTALQQEQEALIAANRQLAQRAATVEQLAESRERNRLARELHDTLAHSMTGLSVQLQALETLMPYDTAAAQDLLKEAQHTVRSGIQESRRAIQALRAAPLEELGLSEALRLLCRRLGERTSVSLICHVQDIAALDPLTEQAVYRIAEAALSNVEQHSAAQRVSVRFQRRQPGSGHLLQISDNGVGFDPSAVPPERYGLAGMRERAQLIGASLQVLSAPGRGTEIVLEIADASESSWTRPPWGLSHA